MSSPLSRLTRGGEYTLAHYAWVIVAVGAVAQMVGSTIRNAFGVFVDPLMETFGWSAGAVGFSYAWMSVVTALFSPVAGWLGNRYGARKTMTAGSLLFLSGMIWTAGVSSVWELYAAYGVLLGIAQALFLVPVIPAVAAWFRRHLGLGTGILMVSWSLGPAIMIQLMALLLTTIGWRDTFLVTGVLGSIVMFTLMLIFRDSPEQAGRKPFGWQPGDEPLVTRGREFISRSKEFQGFVYRTNAFWNLINIHFLGCVGHAIILVGIVPMAIHRGLSPMTAAGVLATLSAVSVFSRFASPVLAERIGGRSVMFFAFAGQGLAVLLLLGAHDVLAFYVFAVAFGLPYGGEGTVYPVVNRQYYGHLPMGTTYGWQLLGAGLGMALGGALPGVLFDLTAGYTVAIIVSAAASLAGAAVILVLEPTRRLLIPNWESVSIRPEAPPGTEPATATD